MTCACKHIRIKESCSGIKIRLILILLLFMIVLASCRKWNDINEDPEIEPLIHGIKTSAAVGYCASIAAAYFMDGIVPGNAIVTLKKKSSREESMIMIVDIDDSYPLPFDSYEGQITIAGVWNGNGGVITALFTDMDLLGSFMFFKGIHTIPLIDMGNGEIMTLFAEQDVIMGEGSDTLLHLNMEIAWINIELKRLEADLPADAFVAAKQNVWFVTANRNSTIQDFYDDEFTVNGGGQIAQVSSSSGGVIYHALIDAKFNYASCERNPISGIGFIQHIEVGTEMDLGHIMLGFHDQCDGKADVDFATGKYLSSNFNTVNLNFN
jgi:hypothetical protein